MKYVFYPNDLPLPFKSVIDNCPIHLTEAVTMSHFNLTTRNQTDSTDEPGQDDQQSEDDEDHPLYDISQKLFLVVIPLITVLGVVSNTFTFLVMRRPSLRKTPVAVYMSALSFSDSLVLLLDFINNWLHFVSGYHITSSSEIFCQFYNFVFQSAITLSSWLVVAVAIERLIVVWMPLRAKTLCTVRKAVIFVCVMPVVCLLLQSYNFLIWKLNDDREGRCDMNPEYEFFHRYVYSPLNNAAYCYVPVLILIVVNAAIVVGLTRANKARKRLGTEESSEIRRVTVSVVTICVTFVCLTVPLTLFYVIIYSSDQFVTQSPSMALGRTLVLIIGLSNYAINFYLYVLTSDNFRRELRALFGCQKSVENRNRILVSGRRGANNDSGVSGSSGKMTSGKTTETGVAGNGMSESGVSGSDMSQAEDSRNEMSEAEVSKDKVSEQEMSRNDVSKTGVSVNFQETDALPEVHQDPV